jgi:uncharacterized repeat protein (TIGR01451 family)
MATDLGSGVLYEPSTTGSGTGNYDSFLRLAANGTEEGFNTDDNHEADNKDGIWTHSLQVGSLQSVTIDSVDYYIIRLDLNEIQSGDNPNITLEELRIFRSTDAADGDDFDADFAGLTEVFDLSGSLNLVDTNHGSGTDDYVFYIPVSLFPDPAEYFTLYADFSGSDDGFEEFRALSTVFTPQPDIGILKETNGTDDQCLNILTGESVTWTYTVENNGNLVLSNVVVTDDNGTPLDTSDDFNATYVSGDTNLDGKLGTTETWIFSASGTAQEGEYHNIATVVGDWTFGAGSGTVTSFEEDCYVGVTPSIAILKTTNGTDNLCPVVAVGETVTWAYSVTNTGDIGLTNVVVTDNNGTLLDNSDDFNPDAVLGADLIHNIGDVNNDDVLDLTETWQYTASGTAVEGHYDNIATVTGDATDDYQNSTTVNASEDDCYIGVEGPGVRTPGFWQNMRNGGQFWDGIGGNEKNAGADCFAVGELLYAVDSNHDGVIDGTDQKGLLIGDYDHDGLTGSGEDTLFVSYADARSLINASNKQLNSLSGDGKFMLGRDMVATWLNYLVGNSLGDESDTGSPHHYMDDSIDWMQIFSGTTNGGTGENFDTFKLAGPAIKTSSATWNSPQSGIDHSASQMHSALDGYNNTGTIDGIVYAHSCDNETFLSSLKGFSMDGAIYLV